jgi:hypothetical protein
VSQQPKLPSLRALTQQLRELHEAWSHPDAGGEYVSLYLPGQGWHLAVGATPDGRRIYGREYVPGSVEREGPTFDGDCLGGACATCHGSGYVSVPTPFDATAAARRLLAAARDAQAHP